MPGLCRVQGQMRLKAALHKVYLTWKGVHFHKRPRAIAGEESCGGGAPESSTKGGC